MRNMTDLEMRTYNFIKDAGEVQTTNLPDKRMWGAIPNLKNMGLIEVFKRYTSCFRRRKKNFVKIKQ
jgi:hypothetical protein